MTYFYCRHRGIIVLAIFILVVTLLSFGPAGCLADDAKINLGDALDKADEFSAKAGYPTGENTVQSPEIVIGRIIQYVMSFLGAVFFALIVYGGWRWLAAAGNEEEVTKAKDLILHSLIGLFIVFAAYLISAFALTKILESIGQSDRSS